MSKVGASGGVVQQPSGKIVENGPKFNDSHMSPVLKQVHATFELSHNFRGAIAPRDFPLILVAK